MIILGKTKDEWKKLAYSNADYLICFVLGLILGLLI
jgi:hypothetical protein